VHIFPFENAGDIHDRLMKQGARLVIRTVEGLSDNTIKPQPQTLFIKPGEVLKLAPKIYPKDCIINWNNDPVTIHNLIRGLAPAPCARSLLRKDSADFSFKIFESRPETIKHNMNPGEIITDGKHFIRIACRDGFLNVISLQLEGRKRMNSEEFLRGFKLEEHTIPVS